MLIYDEWKIVYHSRHVNSELVRSLPIKEKETEDLLYLATQKF